MHFGNWKAAVAYFYSEGFEVAHAQCENGDAVQVVAFDPKHAARLACPGCGGRLMVLAMIREADFDG